MIHIELFNGWYFFWLLLCGGVTAGLYFLLRGRSVKVQKGVLFGFLALGLALHFLKVYIPPYSVDEARMLRDSWFVNVCAANIALFPFFFWSKNEKVKDYMFYLGVMSGIIVLFYPEEPLDKVDQAAEQLDIIRFYYHHWMVMAVPMLMALLGIHKPSYRRIWMAPVGLLLVMLFIMLNQIFQSELGFVPLRDRGNFFGIDYKNSSYIWGPGDGYPVGELLKKFTPEVFTKVPIGEHAGETKYWPWFWMICPVFCITIPLAAILALIFDFKSIRADVKALCAKLKGGKKEETVQQKL